MSSEKSNPTEFEQSTMPSIEQIMAQMKEQAVESPEKKANDTSTEPTKANGGKEVNEPKKELEAAQVEVNEPKQELEAAQAEVNELKQKPEAAQVEVNEPKQELEAAQVEVNELKEELKAAQAEVNELKEELRSTENKLTTEKERSNVMVNKVEDNCNALKSPPSSLENTTPAKRKQHDLSQSVITPTDEKDRKTQKTGTENDIDCPVCSKKTDK